MNQNFVSSILSVFLIPFCTSALPSTFYSAFEQHEFNCSFQFKSPKAFECGCIDGLWKFYETECQELMVVGGNRQFCFPINRNVIRGEMILPDKHSLSVVKEGVVIPLLTSQLPIAGEEGDEIYAGKEWTLSDDDGNSVCLATHPNSYCVFKASDFGLFQITHAKVGCVEEMYSVLPRNCYTMHSENKNICGHRIQKRQIKRVMMGRVLFGAPGQTLKTSNSSTLNNTYDEDYVNETLHVIPEDTFASEIFNYMDAKLNEILDIHEPTTDFNFLSDPTEFIEPGSTTKDPAPKPFPSDQDQKLEDFSDDPPKKKTYIDLPETPSGDTKSKTKTKQTLIDIDEVSSPSNKPKTKQTLIDIDEVSSPSNKPKTKQTYIDIDEVSSPSNKPKTKQSFIDIDEVSPSNKPKSKQSFIDIDEVSSSKPKSKQTYVDLREKRSKRAVGGRKMVQQDMDTSGVSKVAKILFENRAPVYQLLDLSRRVMAKTCPSFYVPPEFLEIAVSAFVRVNQKYYQFPEDDSYYYGYGRIVQSLLLCEQKITPFNFTVDPCKTRNQVVSGAYCAFGKCGMEVNILAGFENFDPLIETAWNVFVNAHAACFPYFENATYNDHHKFLTWMTPLFQTDINDSWKKGSAKGIVYGGLFGNAENLMAALTYCTASQRLASDYPWDLPRPNKADDLAVISKLRKKREVFYDESGLSGHCSLPQTTGDCGINKLT